MLSLSGRWARRAGRNRGPPL